MIFIDRDCHPQTVAVVRTRARPLGIEIVVADPYTDLERHEAFGVSPQYPGSSGEIRILRPR